MNIGNKIKLSGVSHSGAIVTFTIRKEPRRGHKKYRITWTQSKGDYREEWVENLEDAKAFPKKWEENEKAKMDQRLSSDNSHGYPKTTT